ncbi:hypothetical protein WICPIJ_008771 [Wickerhamomyces pijperi]|uniref:Uncharacterized protein n=1 Tax=Wickerhamomyces pijperi TaxID=599730 RepID=A0A9P8THF6_WICPI|nr:hypothetical protein WICPIJ_008771 [Wickerhamomyces pijperi]
MMAQETHFLHSESMVMLSVGPSRVWHIRNVNNQWGNTGQLGQVGSITAKESRLGGQAVGKERVGVWHVRERGFGVDDTELTLVTGDNRSTIWQMVVSVGRVIKGENNIDVSFWLDEWGNWNVLQIFTTVN